MASDSYTNVPARSIDRVFNSAVTHLKKGVNYTIISTKKSRKWEDMEVEFTSLPDSS